MNEKDRMKEQILRTSGVDPLRCMRCGTSAWSRTKKYLHSRSPSAVLASFLPWQNATP